MGTGGGGGGRSTGGPAPVAGLSAAERDFWLAGVPESHRALVLRVEFERGMVNADGRDLNGTYNYDTGVMTLDASRATRQTARHEAGHAVWFGALSPMQRVRIDNAFNRDIDRLNAERRYNVGDLNRFWISGYAAASPVEAFAEAYAMWTSGAEGVARVSVRADGAFGEILSEVV